MHKGIILLVKADNVSEAQEKAEDFLDGYKHSVWDWYEIGGRWSGNLSEHNPKFIKLATKLFNKKYPETKLDFINDKMIQNCNKELQQIWDKLGGQNNHPYNRNSITTRFDDDIVPMSSAINSIKKWTIDPKKEAEKSFRLILKARREKKKDSTTYDMSGYYANIYASWNYDNFSFESSVYDVEHGTNNPAKAIEQLDTYYAVMVDLHS